MPKTIWVNFFHFIVNLPKTSYGCSNFLPLSFGILQFIHLNILISAFVYAFWSPNLLTNKARLIVYLSYKSFPSISWVFYGQMIVEKHFHFDHPTLSLWVSSSTWRRSLLGISCTVPLFFSYRFKYMDHSIYQSI